MADLEGFDEFGRKLDVLRRKSHAENHGSVTVGYTAQYALYVHENLMAYHPVGNAKFLEGPLRRLRKVLIGIAAQAYQRGVPLIQALYIAGLRLQRESQGECPVDTGNMRASATTRKV